MLVKDILQRLDLGNSVAEFDDDLDKYFVETQTFMDVIGSKGDVVAGDKGAGKTALFRILRARASSVLKNVRIVPAFNPTGSPVFQRLTEGAPLDEAGYAAVWKTYILALVGNWLLKQVAEKDWDRDLQVLDRILAAADLRILDETPVTVFERLLGWTSKRFGGIKSAQVTLGIPHGPAVTPKLEFESGDGVSQPLRYEEALSIVDRILGTRDQKCWPVFDRLDEAFHNAPAIEIPALRALFRVYLDLQAFQNIRLKLFVRRDLFRRVTQGGFVNLTHINSRKIEITWDEDDLKNLLCRRVRENKSFLAEIGLSANATNDQIFDATFPPQVDPGERKTTTWPWMMSRIQDGNGIKPPRNLIDLVKNAQGAQIRQEERELNVHQPRAPLIGSDALKKGLEKLSEERVNDTLLAEVGTEYATLIEKFRDGKAEHNDNSLAEILGVSLDQAKKHAKVLLEIGFLEEVGDSYKIPMLYRGGLNVTQGKAF